ncbi:MAG TPA: polyprenol monophosphomannose synthase [Acidimicrobiales bacterium]|nr:polyprenol monophosphomannose synthase [Acidimicrobiales bacterium]
MRVLVVLPTYNERATIERLLRAVKGALDGADVLVVDDSSPDGTAKIAHEVAEELPGIAVLSRPAKQGLGPAYRAGFAWGLEHDYDVLVEMDSDFSHDPAALPALVEPLTRGYEVSIGSRYVPGGRIPDWTVLRRLLSRGGNVYADVVLSLGVKDSTAGFRAYAASLLRRIDMDGIQADGYGFQIEMTYIARCAGARIAEVPITFVDRVEGTSKMSMRTVTEALRLVTLWGLQRLVARTPDRVRSSGPSPVDGGVSSGT